ncbi:MerR family transcriptional regulator [Bosea sp. ANAM02]|nr:MerR family transcriptional regulator [Bosea sp. ANAM02]
MSLEFHAGETEAELDTKSPDAFRTISEVAEDLDIPQHVLRFWETRFNQIKPLKRGGGRRYYRPDDVALLKGIRRLLYGEGYTIKGLQRILKEQGPRHVQAIGRGAPIGAAPPAEPREAPVASEGFAEVGAERAAPYRQPVPEGLDDVSILTAVMKELGECRRILEQALQPAPDAA